MVQTVTVNGVILNSIPVQAKVKHYLLLKYRWLERHNGIQYAVNIFKDIKQVVMDYVAHPNRHIRLDEYVERLPIANKEIARRLLVLADTRPHFVIDITKMYTGQAHPVVDRTEFAKQHEETVNSIKPLSYTDEKSLVEVLGTTLADTFKYVLRRGKDSGNDIFVYNTEIKFEDGGPTWVQPSDYHLSSDSKDMGKLARDLNSFNNYIKHDLFAKEIRGKWTDVVCSDLPKFPLIPTAQQGYAGEIEYIPKNGTETWRAIGNANKYFNVLSQPFQYYLYEILNALRSDHTFDQNKSDDYIQERLNSGRYVGSVDLSSATEYMPVAPFMQVIISQLIKDGYRDSIVTESARHTYRIQMLPWTSSVTGNTVKWKRGQALGALPSFGILAVTHNLLLISMMKKMMRRGHEFDSLIKDKKLPFAILGDDLIVYDKALREEYISTLTALGSPLSLHKSYEGRMVEFAGKVFIKNQPVRYISDHSLITKNTLFDYQKSTGVFIPFRNLPRSLRTWWTRGFDSIDSEVIYNAYAKYITNTPLDQYELSKVPTIVLSEVLSKQQPLDADDNFINAFPISSILFMSNRLTPGRSQSTWYREKIGVPAGKQVRDSLSQYFRAVTV